MPDYSFINYEHPNYRSSARTWAQYGLLYYGGEELKRRASDFLRRRNREPEEIYRERLDRFFYENYVGSIIDWYASTLLRREPVLLFEGESPIGRRFFNDFAENCDLQGSRLSDFFRARFIETLVCGRSYIALDFPRIETPVATRGEEEAHGFSRAFLVPYRREELINWSEAANGSLDWVVLRQKQLAAADVTQKERAECTTWMYYDRHEFKRYEQHENGGERSAIRLVDEGPHGLSAQAQVPLFHIEMPHGLWLMNRAAHLQIEHLNKSNALAWAITMGLFAMPVVYSDREWTQVVGESYYLQLGPEDRFGWTEPEGRVYSLANDNLARLKDEIYRITYLMEQTREGGSYGAVHSGISKRRDFAITAEILRAYGDCIKDCLGRILNTISVAREDDLRVSVQGLDQFDISDFVDDLNAATGLLQMGVDSPTLKKHVFKTLALKFLCDSTEDVKQRIQDEIDSSN